MGIINTMDNEITSAKELLRGTGISLLDAARFVRNILDSKPAGSKEPDILFCSKVVETGRRHVRSAEMKFSDGFEIYLKSKAHLRPDSLRDIRYLGKRLIKFNPEIAKRNFSEISRSDCEEWLNKTFATPPQFNKGRSFLHAIFEFALKREWLSSNPVKLIEKRRVIEREIKPLTLSEARRLMGCAKSFGGQNCTAAAAILLYAGIRPREVRRLKWRDIDIAENSITVRSACSKTGGARQVEICPALKVFFGRRASSGNFRLPSGLAEALEENPRRGGIRERMGAGRVAAHVRELPCEALSRPAAAAMRHGAPRPHPPALPIRQHARHLFLRRFRVF